MALINSICGDAENHIKKSRLMLQVVITRVRGNQAKLILEGVGTIKTEGGDRRLKSRGSVCYQGCGEILTKHTQGYKP